MPIPSGATTWQSDPNSSPTSPTRSKITPAKVTPSQSGLHREATRAPPSSAKSQCGGPPTASIPKTRDQPEEEANSKRSRPSGNNASTGISPVPPIRQQMRGPTSDRQHTPHLVAGTTTASARTKHPVNVRTGQPHPAANPVELLRRGCGSPDTVMARSHGSTRAQPSAESGSIRIRAPAAHSRRRPGVRVLASLRARLCRGSRSPTRCFRSAVQESERRVFRVPANPSSVSSFVKPIFVHRCASSSQENRTGDCRVHTAQKPGSLLRGLCGSDSSVISTRVGRGVAHPSRIACLEGREGSSRSRSPSESGTNRATRF